MHEKFKMLSAAVIISIALFCSQAVVAENATMDAGLIGETTETDIKYAVIDKISGGFATFLVGRMKWKWWWI